MAIKSKRITAKTGKRVGERRKGSKVKTIKATKPTRGSGGTRTRGATIPKY